MAFGTLGVKIFCRQTAKQPIFLRSSRTREQSNERSGATLKVKCVRVGGGGELVH